MFLNINKFIKLMKEAYKTELKIGNLNDKTVISSGYWVVEIDNERIPNKVKAAIVELAGDLPVSETMFAISKENSIPQMVIENYSITRLLDDVKEAKIKTIVTPVTIDNSIRILQLIHDNYKQICGISEDYYSMIDKSSIDFDIEGEPVGPCVREIDNVMYWYNESGTVAIMPIRMSNSKLLDALNTVDFSNREDI